MRIYLHLIQDRKTTPLRLLQVVSQTPPYQQIIHPLSKRDPLHAMVLGVEDMNAAVAVDG
jgi:hypothetical protein